MFNPNSSSWRATGGRFKSVAEYEDYLYSPGRLDARCNLFLEMSLPQLAEAAQIHPIIHIVSYSSNLPSEYRERLVESAKRYSFLHLDEQDGVRHPTDAHELARKYYISKDDSRIYGLYRLDDDDLLSADFFDQMSRYVNPQYAGMQVSLSRGLTALYTNNEFSNLRETYWPMLAIGLLSVCAITQDGNIVKPVSAPHHVSDRFNPVISDARQISYLWVRHAEQDTALDFGAEATVSKVISSMSRYPAASSDIDFKSLFPHAAAWARPRNEDLVVERSPLEAPIVLKFSKPAAVFDLVVDAEYSADAIKSNGLISFDLRSGTGDEIDRTALSRTRIGESSNTTIGFFRYLETTAGRNVVTYQVSLPSGVECHGVTIMRFKKLDTAITLHSVMAAVTK